MRRANWTHDRGSFFKYASRTAARSILNRGSLRWSAPRLFNDPFDIQFDLHLEYDRERVRGAIINALWDAHYGEIPPPADNILGMLISHLRGVFPRLTREQFEDEFRDAVEEGLARIQARLPEVQQAHRQLLLDEKVLCLSEVNDSILMWSHYSEQHKGIVLEFRCVAEIDSAFGVAEPVVYAQQMPQLFDETFLIQLGSGQRSIDPTRIRKASVLTKAAAWEYEKEWRLVVPSRTGATQDYEDIPFHRSELAAVFLGCRMAEADRLEFSALAAANFPAAKIFQAERHPKKFELVFHEVGPAIGAARPRG